MRNPQPASGVARVHGRFAVLAVQAVVLSVCWSTVHAEPLTLPMDQRPGWLRDEGIVMAGSWEPLLFRVRRDGPDGYMPTAEQRNDYLREHGPEMVARLKDLGVNFIMMHCYKGAGLVAERESMADAVKFAKLCHDWGLHVGVYAYSGALLWEPFFHEVPRACDWVLLDENGKPRTYENVTYRYYWNRNHPAAQAFYQKIVAFAVNEIQADLLHFDNYNVGPGYDGPSVERFHQYLRDTFSPAQLKDAGLDDVNAVRPPTAGSADGLLRRAWLDFSCRSLANSYHEMSRYARTLRRDILMECNPGGPGDSIRPPVDHGRLLQGGEAFWDEGRPPGYRDGQLYTRIRTYKVARGMDNMAFAYATTPLEMAESMAFNLDCLGCICWFEYGDIVAQPGVKTPLSAGVAPFVGFFHARRDLFRGASVVADVAVLRSFPSQVFADSKYARRTCGVEQTLIDNHACFQIIYEDQLDHLTRYRALVLAGSVALSDRRLEQIRRYVQSGGRLCIIGSAATHDEWMSPRTSPAFADLPDSHVIQAPEDGDTISAIQRACGDEIALSVRAGPGLCSELMQQPGRRLVHLVNYRSDPTTDIAVSVRLPGDCRPRSVMLVSPERPDDLPAPFEIRDGRVQFNVPQVRVYEIAVVAAE